MIYDTTFIVGILFHFMQIVKQKIKFIFDFCLWNYKMFCDLWTLMQQNICLESQVALPTPGPLRAKVLTCLYMIKVILTHQNRYTHLFHGQIMLLTA